MTPGGFIHLNTTKGNLSGVRSVSQGRFKCLKKKSSIEHGVIEKKESQPARKPVNSCARRCITSAKESTVPGRHSRQSRLDCQRRAGPECLCQRPQKVRHQQERAAKRNANFGKEKALAAASHPRSGLARSETHFVAKAIPLLRRRASHATRMP
jgi:hypothetical protein